MSEVLPRYPLITLFHEMTKQALKTSANARNWKGHAVLYWQMVALSPTYFQLSPEKASRKTFWMGGIPFSQTPGISNSPSSNKIYRGSFLVELVNVLISIFDVLMKQLDILHRTN